MCGVDVDVLYESDRAGGGRSGDDVPSKIPGSVEGRHGSFGRQSFKRPQGFTSNSRRRVWVQYDLEFVFEKVVSVKDRFEEME